DLRSDVVSLAASLAGLLADRALDLLDLTRESFQSLMKLLSSLAQRPQGHRDVLRRALPFDLLDLTREGLRPLVKLLSSLAERPQGHRHVVFRRALALLTSVEPVLERPQARLMVSLAGRRRTLDGVEASGDRVVLFGESGGQRPGLALERLDPSGDRR